MEKENMFLRQEIERVKYSKDKDSYGRFMAGLMKNKGGSSMKVEQEPLKEITISNVNKRIEFTEEILAPPK